MPRRFLALFLLAGDGRAGKDELPVFTTFIHKMSYGIPQDREILPFVNQTRRKTFKKDRWLCLDGCTIFIYIVRVLQFDDTFRMLFASTRLATPLWPLYQDSAHAFKVKIQDIIYYPFLVFWSHRIKSFFIYDAVYYSIYRRKQSMRLPKIKGFYSQNLKDYIPKK